MPAQASMMNRDIPLAWRAGMWTATDMLDTLLMGAVNAWIPACPRGR